MTKMIGLNEIMIDNHHSIAFYAKLTEINAHFQRRLTETICTEVRELLIELVN